MAITDNIRTIEFDRNRRKTFRIKSGIIWGHSNKTNSSYPLLYISKPRGVSKEDFEYLLDHLDISLRK
jgi:hypothetical protein